MADLEFRSPLTPEDCVARIKRETDPDEPGLRMKGSRPVLAAIDGSTIRLRRRLSARNAFQPILTVSLRPEGGGTAVIGRIGLSVWVKAFVGVWVVFASLIGAAAAVVFGGSWSKPLMLVVPLVGIAFLAGLERFGRRLAAGQAEFLADLLKRTLSA